MGNMSHPVVTRLGVNQFWYKHWYSDNRHSNVLRHSKSLERVVKLYLNYGLTSKSNIFIHEYWYKPSYSRIRTVTSTDHSLCFRRFFYTNSTLGIEHSYLIRINTPEYFPMKFWLFRYNGWFIVSVKWFKPAKTKGSRRRKSGAGYVTSVTKNLKTKAATKRLKLLLTLMRTNLLRPQIPYNF